MNCDACRPLIGPYVDGELDLVAHLEVEAHLRTCAGCARAAESLRAAAAPLRSALPRRAAPPALVATALPGRLAGRAPPSATPSSPDWPLWS